MKATHFHHFGNFRLHDWLNNFLKDQIDHEKLYPCSTSIAEITSNCWSFARNETAEETCIVQVEPCDDLGDNSDQSEDEDDELSTSCVKIIDDIDMQDLKFPNGTPIICKDQISSFFIGLSEGDLTKGTSNTTPLGRTNKETARLNLKQAPGNLLDFINQYYQTGEPEVESDIQIDYEGTEFEEPEILPPNKNECNGDDENDGNDYHVDNSDEGNF